jgi:hypothetical protein
MHVSRVRRGLLAAAVCACLVAVVSCAAAGGPSASRPHALPPGVAGLLGSGTLYLLAGPGPFSANLWRVQLPSGATRELTFNPPEYGVSNFSASAAGLVMGDARTGVDLVDALRHGKLVPMEGGVGDDPQINAAGQVAFLISSGPPNKGVWAENRVALQRSISAPYRTILASTKYAVVAPDSWSPDGQEILISENPENNSFTRMLIVSPDGRVQRTLPILAGDPDNILWGRAGVAIGWTTSSGPNEVISLSGKLAYPIPSGWVPMCWNPAGTELLVGRGSGQHELGLWRLSAPGGVQALGGLRLGGLLQCDWIARPAAGT